MLRTALGMKSRQLAERVGVSRQAIERIEKDEGEKSLNTDTLENIADALGCKFVYAFVPKEDPLIFVDKAAQQKAIEIVDSLQHTMALEDQKTNQQSRDELIANIKQQLLSNPLKEGLWDK